jgi:hypothetical protein
MELAKIIIRLYGDFLEMARFMTSIACFNFAPNLRWLYKFTKCNSRLG